MYQKNGTTWDYVPKIGVPCCQKIISFGSTRIDTVCMRAKECKLTDDVDVGNWKCGFYDFCKDCDHRFKCATERK